METPVTTLCFDAVHCINCWTRKFKIIYDSESFLFYHVHISSIGDTQFEKHKLRDVPGIAKSSWRLVKVVEDLHKVQRFSFEKPFISSKMFVGIGLSLVKECDLGTHSLMFPY